MKQSTLDGYQVDEDRVCPTCGKICANQAGMRRHHSWIHDESIAKTTHVCDKCGREKEMYQYKAEKYNSGLCVHCARERPTNHDEEARRKMSEAIQAADYEYTQEHMEKCWAGWQEWYEDGGDEEMREWLEGTHLDEMPEDAKQQISETLMGHDVSDETRRKLSKNHSSSGPLSIDVEETGHTVRSNWEAEIDRLLAGAVDGHEYEPDRMKIGDRWYTPDFRVGDTVIEVKGYARDHDHERAEKFLQHYPELTYVAVGDEIPCDIHIPWGERERLRSLL